LKVFSTLVPVLILYLVLALILAAVHFKRRQQKAKKRRSPFSDNFLRSPGESLGNKLQDIQEEVTEILVSSIVMPLIIYAAYISTVHLEGPDVSFGALSLLIGFGVVFEVVVIRRLLKVIDLRRIYRLGYEGERATGQELNQLMKDGYSVYHDFPANGFNIDHIVVGHAGVYAVETKARSKPTSGDAVKDAKVQYDGQTLQFPGWHDSKPLDQAKNQAKWLNKWLTSAVGAPVEVKPVVTLPGWFVERTSSKGIPVINPKLFRSILNAKGAAPLDPEMIQRINHQLDQKCRDIEPTPNS
jgi:hypothetical protein